MPNGKIGDNPISDMFLHDSHPFPPDMEEMIRELHKINRIAFDDNFSSDVFNWEQGKHLEEGRAKLQQLLAQYRAL